MYYINDIFKAARKPNLFLRVISPTKNKLTQNQTNNTYMIKKGKYR